MALIRSVTVGDRTIALYAFTGEVVDEKKWGTTEVGSSGGGYNAGSGQNNPVTISSVSHTHDQFFLKNDSGQEMAVETTDAGLALRKGPWKFIPHSPKSPAKQAEPGDKSTGPPDPAGVQLFNLSEDAGETKNLAEQHPEMIQELSELLDRIRKSGRSRP